MCHIFHFSHSDKVFGIVNPFNFREYLMPSPSEMISMAFLLASIDLRTAKFFPPAEPFLVSSNFRRASPMQGGRSHSVFANGPKSHAKWTLRVTLPIVKRGYGTTQVPVMERI